jgi:hypothetical protein
MYSLILPFICVHAFMHSIVHSFIHSFMHSVMHAFIHPFLYLRICVLIHSCIKLRTSPLSLNINSGDPVSVSTSTSSGASSGANRHAATDGDVDADADARSRNKWRSSIALVCGMPLIHQQQQSQQSHQQQRRYPWGVDEIFACVGGWQGSVVGNSGNAHVGGMKVVRHIKLDARLT